MKTRLERGKNMKNKKGFTLIELLAVIVILAIIALIAVPVVMNIISRANKSAFKDSAYGVLKAGENYYMGELLNTQGMTSDKIFDFSKDTSELEINGSKPTNGKMIVNTNGKVAMAIHNGRHCVTKGFNDDDVTITDDIENCKLPGYSVGDIVYYNPNEAKVCIEAEWNNNADKNGKSGCMRWYVYATVGGKAKLILDHNTTAKVAWVTEEDYEDAGGENWDWIDEYEVLQSGNSEKGPVTLLKQLKKDTTNWKVKADIITVEEVMNLLPYYQGLSSSEQQAYLNGDEEAADKYFEYSNTFVENVCSKSEENAAICNSGNSDYMLELLVNQPYSIMLPTYMWKDVLDACPSGEDCPTYGYWTQTAYAGFSGSVWVVGGGGDVDRTAVVGFGDSANDDYGVRPVITLSK